ncbi:dienelactone hydrolase family protein [Terricaulis sp.]|uniref:dienelactone hydrolase family protein n=1 Tax=Terricaulis sp. TaxID=2768686 RepID=UPI003783BCD1
MPVFASAETVAERIARLEPSMSVVRPEGPGPFPVVIMLHGCGGRRPFHDDIAAMLAREGAAAIVVDSFAPRRISRIQAYSTVCTGARLQGRERAGDLYAALEYARQQRWADPERLIAAGWSHGGWTIIDGMAMRSGAEMTRATGLTDLPAEPMTGVTSTLLAYPYAGIGSLAARREWRIHPHSVAILAGRDYIVGWKMPREALERQRARGADLEILFFENSTHAFEDDQARDLRVRYDADATAREYDVLRALVAHASVAPAPAR